MRIVPDRGVGLPTKERKEVAGESEPVEVGEEGVDLEYVSNPFRTDASVEIEVEAVASALNEDEVLDSAGIPSCAECLSNSAKEGYQ